MSARVRQTATAERPPRWKARGALLAVFALSLARDAYLLFSFPVAVGTDGYYYVLQVQELITHGRLYFPSNTPLIFYILALLGMLTGDSVVAVKIGALAFHLLLCVGIYALVSAITRNEWLGVLGGAITALSAMHLYMIVEFIKNLGAVTFLVWGAWAAFRLSQTRQARWGVFSATILLAALLSHRSTWALMSALLCLAIPFHLLRATRWNTRSMLGLASLAVLLGMTPVIFANQTAIHFPASIGGELLASAEWPLGVAGVGRADRFTLFLAAPTALFFIWYRRRESTPPYLGLTVGTVALWSLLVTLNPFLNHDVRELGIVGRLDHLMYLQVAIIVPGVIRFSFGSALKIRYALATLALLLMAMSMISPLPRAVRPQYLSNRLQMIRALPDVRQEMIGNPTVIAQHGDEFVIRWVLGLRAQQKVTEDTRSQSTYWLLHNVLPSTLTPSMTVVMEEGDMCLALVKAEELPPWLDSLAEQERKHLIIQNSHLRKHLKYYSPLDDQ
jgi:hypothetical protein